MENETTNAADMVVANGGLSLDATTIGNGAFTTSVDMTNNAGKLQVFAALQESEKLEDHLGEDIKLKDVILQNVTVTNSDTGEIEETVRVTLISSEGVAYSCVSSQVLASLRSMFNIFGNPKTWDKPIVVKIEEAKSRSGRKFYQMTPVIK